MCRDDESANATENAVAALGKALQHTQNLPDSSGVAELWVQALPLTVDADEAKIAHKQLVGYIQSSDQRYAITCVCHQKWTVGSAGDIAVGDCQNEPGRSHGIHCSWA